MSQVNSGHLMQHIIFMLMLSDSRIVPKPLKAKGSIGRIYSKTMHMMNKNTADKATISSISTYIKKQINL